LPSAVWFDTASLQNAGIRLASVIPSLDPTHVGVTNTQSIFFRNAVKGLCGPSFTLFLFQVPILGGLNLTLNPNEVVAIVRQRGLDFFWQLILTD
jgi:hypothetical protein